MRTSITLDDDVYQLASLYALGVGYAWRGVASWCGSEAAPRSSPESMDQNCAERFAGLCFARQVITSEM